MKTMYEEVAERLTRAISKAMLHIEGVGFDADDLDGAINLQIRNGVLVEITFIDMRNEPIENIHVPHDPPPASEMASASAKVIAYDGMPGGLNAAIERATEAREGGAKPYTPKRNVINPGQPDDWPMLDSAGHIVEDTGEAADELPDESI